jgi:Zn-dependent M28 family amino/carboxypeptidase
MLAALVLAAWPRSAGARGENLQEFGDALTVGGIRAHQARFQALAEANGGYRVAGTGGHDASARYVHDQARAAGYDVRFQEFTFTLTTDRTPPILQRVAPVPRTLARIEDFVTAFYSGSGEVTAPVVAVSLTVPSPEPNASASGCQAADFAGFPPGSIALVQRGTCLFREKVDNALAAGAAAVILFNEGNEGRTALIIPLLSEPAVSLPVVGTTFAAGDELRNGVLNGPTGVTVRLRTDVINEERTTRNVIAETREGDPGRVVVVGAHLDSASLSPGINDDGSGSAVILEIARVYAAEHRRPRNKLRFIWFSAEEFSLLGSTLYVDSLTPTDLDGILVMLNVEAVSSPNFVRFVVDGDDAALPGSELIEQVFLEHFAARGLPTEPLPLGGLSDEIPFMAVGIPVGGLYTGLSGLKTAAQAAVFGGTAGTRYDACWRLSCDTFDHTNPTVLDEMAGAAGHAVLFFSETTRNVRGARP